MIKIPSQSLQFINLNKIPKTEYHYSATNKQVSRKSKAIPSLLFISRVSAIPIIGINYAELQTLKV